MKSQKAAGYGKEKAAALQTGQNIVRTSRIMAPDTGETRTTRSLIMREILRARMTGHGMMHRLETIRTDLSVNGSLM